MEKRLSMLLACLFLSLGMALAHKETAGLETVREAIVAVMDACDGHGDKLGWTIESLSAGFRAIRGGQLPNMAGASGSWVFDRETHISQLGTWYGHWRFYDGAYHFVEYLTRSDYADKASMDQLWNMEMDDRPPLRVGITTATRQMPSTSTVCLETPVTMMTTSCSSPRTTWPTILKIPIPVWCT